MIRLSNIAKRYDTKAGFIYVLQQINVTIEAGEFVTIMGPSGAGKTTLLNIIGMLDGAWEGEYYLDDNPVHELKPKARLALNRTYIGFVFQNFNLLENLTVYENLEAPLSYRNVKGSERASSPSRASITPFSSSLSSRRSRFTRNSSWFLPG